MKLKRYSNNFKKEGISEAQQEKLKNARVIVMGIGGLGSGVVMNLAALGVEQIKLIDCEVIKEEDVKRFEGPLPDFNSSMFRCEDWGALCVLTNEEINEIFF